MNGILVDEQQRQGVVYEDEKTVVAIERRRRRRLTCFLRNAPRIVLLSWLSVQQRKLNSNDGGAARRTALPLCVCFRGEKPANFFLPPPAHRCIQGGRFEPLLREREEGAHRD